MDDRVSTSTLTAQRSRPGFAWVAFLVVAIVAVGAGLAYLWWRGTLYPSTDDAYLGAHVVDVGSAVAGRIAQVGVVENQQVKAGDVLFRLDGRPFDYAVAAAQANLDQTMQTIGSGDAAIDEAQATVAQRQAALTNAQADADRARRLYASGDTAKSVLDTAEANLAMAEANLPGAQADLTRQETELGQRNTEKARVPRAAAALSSAQ